MILIQTGCQMVGSSYMVSTQPIRMIAMMIPDADGVNFNPDDDDYFDRSWSNLDEFRFVSSTEQGWNTTNPQLADTDGDGLV